MMFKYGCFAHPQINPFPPKRVYGRAADLAIMYLEYRATFWGRCQLCVYVRQNSAVDIAGFSSNQESIWGTD